MVTEIKQTKQGGTTVQIEIADSARDSISLKRDAKGNYAYEIKIYDFEGENIPERIESIAKDIEERIRKLKED